MSFNRAHTYLSVFLCGAVVLIIEILGTRIVAPYYGNTLYVWSSLISVAILSLSLGYYLGGKVADKWPSEKIFNQILILIAFFIFIIPFIDKFILVNTESLGLRLGALTSTFIIFSVPLTALGTISPFAIRLVTSNLSSVGSSSGRVYALSSVGSCVGALLTGFVLIPNLKVSTIVFITGGSLLFLTLLWVLTNKSWKMIFAFLAFCPFLFFADDSQSSEVIHVRQSLLGEIKVIDRGVHRILLVDGGPQSWVERNSLQASSNFPQMVNLAYFARPQAKEALVIGLGAGSVSRHLSHHWKLNVETVEFDKNIVEVAEQYFGYSGEVVVDDGRRFLRNAIEKYGLIIFDINFADAFPTHIFTLEGFNEAKKALSNDGVLLVDFFGLVTSMQVKSLYKTLKAVFPNVLVVKTGGELTSNIVFFVSDKPIDIKVILDNAKKFEENAGQLEAYQYILENNVVSDIDGGIVLTDEYSPLDIWQIEAMEKWREFALSQFG